MSLWRWQFGTGSGEQSLHLSLWQIKVLFRAQMTWMQRYLKHFHSNFTVLHELYTGHGTVSHFSYLDYRKMADNSETLTQWHFNLNCIGLSSFYGDRERTYIKKVHISNYKTDFFIYACMSSEALYSSEIWTIKKNYKKLLEEIEMSLSTNEH